MVVDDNLNNGNIVTAGRCQFVHVHPEASVPCDVDAELVRLAQLRADAGPQAVAHGPQAAGRKEGAGPGIAVILRRPHLVLAYVRGDQGVPLGDPVYGLYDIGAGQLVVIVFQRVLLFQGGNRLHPFPVILSGNPPVQLLEHQLQVAHQAHVRTDVLIDFRRVHIDVENFGMLREFPGIADHPVGEPGPQGDQQVALADAQVGGLGAVHADHAGIAFTSAVESPLPHEGVAHGRVYQFRESRHFLIRAGDDRAAAQVDIGLLRRLDVCHGLLQLLLRTAAGGVLLLGGHGRVLADSRRHVLGDIHQHRPGTAAPGDGERAP